ncbi:hypothetical protein JK364_23155 [Streptomyces sp. 110]|uniref:Uncharacterized protein n=1 Tax=Streptomyces endocoffeicus TaxID=2898945 RepID=A0ABS1PS83_9ACTN|nr:hypothetical protein [Streptomyces endocoffeicus]MBL1115273.1 hypothetical protein [Streptomyces endocoffeicus]
MTFEAFPDRPPQHLPRRDPQTGLRAIVPEEPEPLPVNLFCVPAGQVPESRLNLSRLRRVRVVADEGPEPAA